MLDDEPSILLCWMMNHPVVLDDEPQVPVTSPTPTLVPVHYVSPADIRPFPTVQSQAPRRKVKRGRTMVLTATPNVQELRASKKTISEPKLKKARKQLVNVFQKSKNKEYSFCDDDDNEEFSSDSNEGSDSNESCKKTLTLRDAENLVTNDFVQVRLKPENSEAFKEYVGQVLKINPISNMVQVKFLRPYRQHKDTFVFPDVQDISMIEKHEITGKLENYVKLRHGQLRFS